MYTTQAPSRPVHRQFPGGPPLAGLAVTATALFLAGLIASTAVAGTAFPSPSDPAAGILAYFRDHPDAVTVSGFFQFAASVPLAIHAATENMRSLEDRLIALFWHLAERWGSREQNTVASGSLMRKSQSVVGFWLMHCLGREDMMRGPLEDLFERAAHGQLKPLVGETYGLADVARAHEPY